MSRSKVSIFIDILILSLCLSLVVFAWVQRYAKNMWISLFVSFGFAFVLSFAILKISFKKNNKLLQYSKDVAFANECFAYLSTNKKQCMAFFQELLNANFCSNKHMLFANGKTYYIDYESEELTNKDICSIKNKGTKNVVILAHSLSQTAEQTCKLFSFEFLSKEQVFLIMKQKNMFPTTPQKNAKTIKNKLKTLLFLSFDRKKAKHFLFYGALLLFISFIVPFTFMYCIFGTISIFWGLLCYVIRPKETISK